MDWAVVVSSPTLSLQDATKELGFCTSLQRWFPLRWFTLIQRALYSF